MGFTQNYYKGVVAHRRVLEKFHIGDLDIKDPAAQALLEYEADLAEGQFYYVLKQRVERLLKDKKVCDFWLLKYKKMCDFCCASCRNSLGLLAAGL
jgi:hypothetical protein